MKSVFIQTLFVLVHFHVDHGISKMIPIPNYFSGSFYDSEDILGSEIVNVNVRKARSQNTEIEDFLGEEDEDIYDISYRAFDEDVSIRVRRAESEHPDDTIYGDNFKVVTLDMDPHGQHVMEDETPSKDKLRDTENRVYVNPETHTAVQIKHTENGTQVHGILSGRSIAPVNTEDGEDEEKHEIILPKPPKYTDFVDHNRTTRPNKGRTAFVGIPFVEPEVFVVLDMDNTEVHKGDVNKIMDYLTILFKSVNNRFDSLKDSMKINFKIAGLITIKSYNSQPFIENNAVLGGKGYDIVKVLDHFSKWVYEHKDKLPKHDLAALLTGKEMYSLENGQYQDGVTGFAYVKGACWTNHEEKKYMGTSVTEDMGGYWFGVFSVAHELAHNLGVHHDGQKGVTEDCPWSQGFLMSYEGWGEKSKYYFSKCSARSMKEFLVSTGADCMKFKQASKQWKTAAKDIGDKLSMKAMCIKFTKNEDAFVEPTKSPSELCANLVCRIPIKNSKKYNFMELKHGPGDNVPCGKGKRCNAGECVVAAKRG